MELKFVILYLFRAEFMTMYPLFIIPENQGMVAYNQDLNFCIQNTAVHFYLMVFIFCNSESDPLCRDRKEWRTEGFTESL